MREFYERYYAAVATSQAHAAFCKRVFGRNLAQHGFADMAQIEVAIACLDLEGDHTGARRVLDLGCGNGMISEYVAARTGAHVTGVDFIAEAIRQAQARTAVKAQQLTFLVADLNEFEPARAYYDAVLAIDSLYFSYNLADTISRLVQGLKPGGQMALFYSYGREPWVPVDAFPAEALVPHGTPLARALQMHDLGYEVQDFTAADLELAERRREALTELRPQFEAEDILFIYDNRMGDAMGISGAIRQGLHRRYLYHVHT